VLRLVAAGAILLAGIAAQAPKAEAAFIATAQQVGGNVDVVGSGTLDLTDLTLFTSGSGGAYIQPDDAQILLGASNVLIYFGLTGPGNFGSGGAAPNSSRTGEAVGLAEIVSTLDLFVPADYVSRSSLTSSADFTGSFAGIGITPGTYVWTWGSSGDADSFTLRFAVPEPASALLLGLPLAGTLLARRRTARGQA